MAGEPVPSRGVLRNHVAVLGAHNAYNGAIAPSWTKGDPQLVLGKYGRRSPVSRLEGMNERGAEESFRTLAAITYSIGVAKLYERWRRVMTLGATLFANR
jgi:hypothetical protein